MTVTRVTFGNFTDDSQPALHPDQVLPTARVYGGATRANIGGGQASTEELAPASSTSAPTEAPQGIAASLQRTFGTPSVELIPGRPETRTSVADALRQGYLREASPGHYVDTGKAFGAAPAGGDDNQTDVRAAAPQDATGSAHFSASEDAALAQAIEPLPQHAWDGAVSSALRLVSTGQGDYEGIAEALARDSGIEPGEAAQIIEGWAEIQGRTVGRAVASLGIQGERFQAFYDWLPGRPGEYRHALEQLVHARDLSAMQALAVEFRRADQSDLEGIKQAGFETHVPTDAGPVLVRKGQGPWVRLDAVLKQARGAA